MLYHIPWIKNRRKVLVSIILDFILVIFCHLIIYSSLFISLPNILITFCLSIYWIVSSYILGRYTIFNKNNSIFYIKPLLKIIFVFILSNVIYLILNWANNIYKLIILDININNDLLKTQSLVFLKTTIIISILSFITQYIISLVNKKIYNSQKYWIFVGSKSGLNNLKREQEINRKYH